MMRTYLISYDLSEPATIKNILNSEIMELGSSWARPLANTWYIRARETQDEIEARLRDHLDIDDGLLIQQVQGDATMLNTGLRWFRQRQSATVSAEASTTVDGVAVNGAEVDSAVTATIVAFPAAMPSAHEGQVANDDLSFAKAG